MKNDLPEIIREMQGKPDFVGVLFICLLLATALYIGLFIIFSH